MSGHGEPPTVGGVGPGAETLLSCSYPCTTSIIGGSGGLAGREPASRLTVIGARKGREVPWQREEGWGVNLTKYPDGGAEITVYAKRPAVVRVFSSRLKRERLPCQVQAVRAKKDRRAGSKVRRLVRQSALRMMVSFTWPEPGQFDRARAMRSARAFVKEHAALVCQGFPWLQVPELHPKGHGWHVHLFTGVKWYKGEDLARLRGLWTDYLVRRGWVLPYGVEVFRVNAKHWGSGAEAGFYAAKYAAKVVGSEGRASRAQRYAVSRGLGLDVARDMVENWWDAAKLAGPRGLVAWRLPWMDDDAEPGTWPVAWFAFEPDSNFDLLAKTRARKPLRAKVGSRRGKPQERML